MMKQYIKSFLPDFRPVRGTDASFDLQNFEDKDFDCPIKRGDGSCKTRKGCFI